MNRRVTSSGQPPDARLLLYAPNVHTGGGLVLLKALLAAWPAGRPLVAWLDARARQNLVLPVGASVEWVVPRIASRVSGERSLYREARAGDTVLCFHGLPPWRRLAGRVDVFLQNRLLIDSADLSRFSWKTRLRLRLERWLSRSHRHHVSGYWVQTPSMARALRDWFGPGQVPVHVLPFTPDWVPGEPQPPEWDFVYVADGEAHKNHRRLVEAWKLLAAQGLKPSLALTLSARDTALSGWIEAQAREHGLRITDLRGQSHAEVLGLYGRSRALVFPSLGESFGLPLIEARRQGLPILAAELDFVRDVCEPVQTFDPLSAVSIARAVQRFLGAPSAMVEPVRAEDFLVALFEGLPRA